MSEKIDNVRVTDLETIIEEAASIYHPTMEDATYGEFLAIGGKYSACNDVIRNSAYLSYLGTLPPSEERSEKVKDTERRLTTARQLYHMFDGVAQKSDLNADAADMIKFFQKPSAQIDEMEDSNVEDLEEQAALLNTTVDELIHAEQLHHAKRARQAIDRAERTAAYALKNQAELANLLVIPVASDYVEMTEQELLRYVNKFSLKIGNPPSKSKVAEKLGHKFKAFNLMEEAKNRYKMAEGINPLLAQQYQGEYLKARSAMFGLAKLEEHINTLVRSLTESIETSARMVINEREGIEMY